MKKILIIEDDELYMDNISILLKEEGYSVIAAVSGLDGIDSAKNENPDLIICDIMMPDINGHTVLQELRKREKTKFIPFIFLTAKSAKSDVREGMNLGADDYITKPFLSDDLLGAVKIRLEKSKQFLNILKQPSIQKNNNEKVGAESYIMLQVNKNYEVTYVKDIVCITSEGVYTNVFTKEGKKILIRRLLKEWENILPEKIFIRVHKSVIINLIYITKAEKWFNESFKLQLKHYPESIIASRRYASQIKKNLII